MRTFVAVDTRVTDGERKSVDDGRVVGFTRWRIPQEDGNLNELWPNLPEDADMNIMGPFFSGMRKNRKELMEGKPHWCKLGSVS